MKREVAFIALLLLPTPAVAGLLPTREQLAVCFDDAHRLCEPMIPNPWKVLACFKQRRGELGMPCAALLKQFHQ